MTASLCPHNDNNDAGVRWSSHKGKTPQGVLLKNNSHTFSCIIYIYKKCRINFNSLISIKSRVAKVNQGRRGDKLSRQEAGLLKSGEHKNLPATPAWPLQFMGLPWPYLFTLFHAAQVRRNPRQTTAWRIIMRRSWPSRMWKAPLWQRELNIFCQSSVRKMDLFEGQSRYQVRLWFKHIPCHFNYGPFFA